MKISRTFFLFSLLILSVLSACSKHEQTLPVYDLLDSMRNMTLDERGKSFAHHVTDYIHSGDQTNATILQDSTMAWIKTLSPSDQHRLADVIENEYRVIGNAMPKDTLR